MKMTEKYSNGDYYWLQMYFLYKRNKIQFSTRKILFHGNFVQKDSGKMSKVGQICKDLFSLIFPNFLNPYSSYETSPSYLQCKNGANNRNQTSEAVYKSRITDRSKLADMLDMSYQFFLLHANCIS